MTSKAEQVVDRLAVGDHDWIMTNIRNQAININEPVVGDIYKNTILHMAIDSKKVDIIKSLIDEGARLDIKNRYGTTAFDMLFTNGLNDILKHIVVQLDQQKDQIMKALDEQKKKNEVLKTYHDNMKVNHDKMKTEYTNMQARYNQFVKINKELNNKLEQKNSMFNELQMKTAHDATTIKELKSDYKKLMEEACETRAKYANYLNKVKDLVEERRYKRLREELDTGLCTLTKRPRTN
jgi:chromosome segregation ATPase